MAEKPAVNPIVDPGLDGAGLLTFDNLAVRDRFAGPPTSYAAAWFVFDNTTGTSRPLGETTSTGTSLAMQAPTGLPAAPGTIVKVALSAQSAAFATWAQPIHVYFRRAPSGWTLVGLERMPKDSQ